MFVAKPLQNCIKALPRSPELALPGTICRMERHHRATRTLPLSQYETISSFFRSFYIFTPPICRPVNLWALCPGISDPMENPGLHLSYPRRTKHSQMRRETPLQGWGLHEATYKGSADYTKFVCVGGGRGVKLQHTLLLYPQSPSWHCNWYW